MMRGNDFIWVEKAKLELQSRPVPPSPPPHYKSNVLPKKNSWLSRLSLLLQQPPPGMEHRVGTGKGCHQTSFLVSCPNHLHLGVLPFCSSGCICLQRRSPGSPNFPLTYRQAGEKQLTFLPMGYIEVYCLDSYIMVLNTNLQLYFKKRTF